MSYKMNSGRGARICDHCRTMLTDGRREILPFVTVRLSETAETGSGFAEAHFERPSCLGAEIARIVDALDSGNPVDDTAADLRLLVIASARWEVAETLKLLPYDDAQTPEAMRTRTIKIV